MRKVSTIMGRGKSPEHNTNSQSREVGEKSK
jgi:hypothetical protein